MKPTACMFGRIATSKVKSFLASDHGSLFSHLRQRESGLMGISKVFRTAMQLELPCGHLEHSSQLHS